MIKMARRSLVVCILLAAVGLTLFLWWREGTIVREGELFEIQANGRVFDYANGHPIPDAWVLLGLHSSNPTIGGYGGGCTDGSAVVKTDANGEFSYRATIRKAGSGRMGFWTFVYHPDYAGELRWRPLTTQGVSIFPINHRPDGVPLFIAMAMRHIGEWKALKGIDDYAQQACLLAASFDTGHAEFSRMRFERGLALHCGPATGANSFPPWDVMDFFEARLNEQAVYAMQPGPERNWQSRDDEIARRSKVKRQLLSNYPWDSTKNEQSSPRDLTAEEKAAFCSFYSLPIKNLINRELLP